MLSKKFQILSNIWTRVLVLINILLPSVPPPDWNTSTRTGSRPKHRHLCGKAFRRTFFFSFLNTLNYYDKSSNNKTALDQCKAELKSYQRFKCRSIRKCTKLWTVKVLVHIIKVVGRFFLICLKCYTRVSPAPKKAKW